MTPRRKLEIIVAASTVMSFIAAAGASAALAGLVFVAVSINIERILKFEELPPRAEMTLLLLITVLLVSIIGLRRTSN